MIQSNHSIQSLFSPSRNGQGFDFTIHDIDGPILTADRRSTLHEILDPNCNGCQSFTVLPQASAPVGKMNAITMQSLLRCCSLTCRVQRITPNFSLGGRYGFSSLALPHPQPAVHDSSASLISISSIRGVNLLEQLWENISIWFTKRTFQPSVIRKRRKQGFLTRQ